MIEEKIQKERDKIIHDWSEAGVRVEKARWGRHHIIKGKQKVEIGKDIDAKKLRFQMQKNIWDRLKTKKKNQVRKNEFRITNSC